MPTPFDFMIPLAISAVILAALIRVRHGVEWGAPLVISAAMLAGALWIARALPPFPPTQAMGWLVYAVLAAGVIGSITIFAPVLLRRGLAVASLSAAVMWLMLRSRVEYQVWTAGELWMWVGVYAGIAVAWWAAWEFLSAKAIGRTVPVIYTGVAMLAAGLALMSGSVLQARYGGALAGAVAGLAVTSFWAGAGVSGRSSAVVVAVGVVGLVVAAKEFSEMTLISAALLLLTPLAAVAGRWITRGACAVRRPVLAVVLRCAIALLPAGVAVALAGPEFIRTVSQEPGSGYGSH